MFEWSKSSVVFLRGHSPYDGSDVFINAAMVAGAEVCKVNVDGNEVKATRITTVGSDRYGVFTVKESFQELSDEVNRRVSKATGV